MTIPRLFHANPAYLLPICGRDFELKIVNPENHIVLHMKPDSTIDLPTNEDVSDGRSISLDIVGDRKGRRFHVAYNLNGVFIRKRVFSSNEPLYLVMAHVPGNFEIRDLLKQEKYHAKLV